MIPAKGALEMQRRAILEGLFKPGLPPTYFNVLPQDIMRSMMSIMCPGKLGRELIDYPDVFFMSEPLIPSPVRGHLRHNEY